MIHCSIADLGCATKATRGVENATTWEKMNSLLHEALLPVDYVQSLFLQLQLIRHWDWLLEEHVEEFHQFDVHKDLNELEEQW